MLARCRNPKVKRYAHYGGRGITVCERWQGPHGYQNFLADMGRKPSTKHTLDRKDPNGHYTPDNCVWATQTEQQNNRRNNRRVVYRGEELTLAQLAARTGHPPLRLRDRLNAGWSVEEAVHEPPRKISS